MIATTPALLIQPDGEVEEIILDSHRSDQLRCIAFHVDGARAHRLGRQAVVHVGQKGETVNNVARQAWMSVTSGSRPPVLRGPVVVTGPADRAGDFAPLPALSAEAVHRASRLLSDTFAVRPSVSGAQRPGKRDQQCDAYAVKRGKGSGRWGFAVLDGFGGTPEARRFARRFAPIVARAAALHGDPARALTAARIQARNENGWDFDPLSDPSAAAVVAVTDQWSPLIRFAWCGNARAYRLTPTGRAVPLTRDHTHAEEWRARGRTPGPKARNVLASCLMRGAIEAGAVERKYTRRLLLCTQGVHAPLEERAHGIGDILDLAADAKEAAATCVANALEVAGLDGLAHDNATALVVDFTQI
ncbi:MULTISPECIES: PP2C family serine/threonine-protein phosphatase [unclassified Streptomyces]|uniref:PP2C family protein-serine/threonine phosphatase n=1 Tax=unclassified Streptomyces TaxID=2593676 RepID=UPI00344A1BDC